MRVVVSGGTGFIGGPLVEELARRGHAVTLLTRSVRSPRSAREGVSTVPWDGASLGPWAERVDGADAVINLAGESVAGGRWTPARKRALADSRLQPTSALVQAMTRAGRKPRVLLNASAVGFYGNVPDGDVTESASKGSGFLPDLCAQWEAAARAAEALGVRVVLLRTGLALGRGGGALQKMAPPFKLWVGGPLGSGRQWAPWVHLDDVVQGMVFVLTCDALSGPVNLTAPEPATMRDLCRSLGRALGRPSWAPVPGVVLKLLLGEMAEMLLTGQRAVPRKLLQAGYQFRYPSLDNALAAIFSTPQAGATASTSRA